MSKEKNMKEKIQGIAYPLFEKVLIGMGIMFMLGIAYILTAFFLGLFPVLFGIMGCK